MKIHRHSRLDVSLSSEQPSFNANLFNQNVRTTTRPETLCIKSSPTLNQVSPQTTSPNHNNSEQLGDDDTLKPIKGEQRPQLIPCRLTVLHPDSSSSCESVCSNSDQKDDAKISTDAPSSFQNEPQDEQGTSLLSEDDAADDSEDMCYNPNEMENKPPPPCPNLLKPSMSTLNHPKLEHSQRDDAHVSPKEETVLDQYSHDIGQQSDSIPFHDLL
ncbi:hypothetical protein BLNAU_21210 [Blattamonas nauphoetae]|uniref:Uncharacterized protein n=1 Tax=Blattamonas nauphoetae TaxID=2049346 RepID=A0ABQ9WX23_9EUKA|nr:hypothetical protein BLNAU_21210 [Blattamonas nauphoetae]